MPYLLKSLFTGSIHWIYLKWWGVAIESGIFHEPQTYKWKIGSDFPAILKLTMQEGKNKAKLIMPSRSGSCEERIKVGIDARKEHGFEVWCSLSFLSNF